MSGKPRRLLAAAAVPAAIAAAVLAGPGTASASTGPRYASAEQARYAATGAQFRIVAASVYLRNPTQYASEVAQYSHTVQLWSSGLVVVLGASASTSGTSYTPYAKIYDASSHQLVSDIAGEWCDPEDNCSSTIGTFPTGDTVILAVTYSRQIPFLDFSAFDLTTGTAFVAGYKPGTGVSFTQARVGTEFGSDPWTAPPSYTHPAAWTKLAVYTKVGLKTYNGKDSTLASWSPHHKIFMSAITGSLIDVQAAPTDLANGGASFQDWLAPAGVNGPAQPPRG